MRKIIVWGLIGLLGFGTYQGAKYYKDHHLAGELTQLIDTTQYNPFADDEIRMSQLRQLPAPKTKDEERTLKTLLENISINETNRGNPDLATTAQIGLDVLSQETYYPKDIAGWSMRLQPAHRDAILTAYLTQCQDASPSTRIDLDTILQIDLLPRYEQLRKATIEANAKYESIAYSSEKEILKETLDRTGVITEVRPNGYTTSYPEHVHGAFVRYWDLVRQENQWLQRYCDADNAMRSMEKTVLDPIEKLLKREIYQIPSEIKNLRY